MILASFIALFAVGFARSQELPACPPTGVHALAYPGSCLRFIRCINGMRSIAECAPGLQFDAVLGQCNRPENANCNPCQWNQPTDVTFIRDIQNCARFTMCIGTVMSENRCSEGLYFNPATNSCALAHTVDCPNSDTTTTTTLVPGPEDPTTPAPGDGSEATCNINANFEILASPESCERHIICACGQPNVRTCPPGLIFDVISQSCNTRQQGQCLSESIPACPNPTTVEQIAHPYDCRYYILCILGTPRLEACAPGLEVNRRTNKCDFPHVAQCTSRAPLTYISLMTGIYA